MTASEKEEYERLAREAVCAAGLVPVTIDPEADYIEALCPDCKKISVYRTSELRQIRCTTCCARRNRGYFYQRSEELIKAAGFSLEFVSFEDDYFEVKCPVCGKITSFHFNELDHIACKYCALIDLAEGNGFRLYWNADAYGTPWWEEQRNEEDPDADESAVLVCRNCGKTHVIRVDAPDAAEQILQCTCSCSVITPELKRLIADRGFSLELHSCPIGYTLKPDEIALLCDRCGDEVIFSLRDQDLVDKIAALTCQSDDCSLEGDLRGLTRQGNMAWCRDMLRVVSILKLSQFNTHTFENGAHMTLPDTGDREVYFAVDPSDNDYAFAFVVYPGETDAWLSKYLLFRFEIATWGVSGANVQTIVRWPGYYDALYQLIKQDIADGSNREPSVTSLTFDRYVAAYNAMHNLNRAFWSVARVSSALADLCNTAGRLVNDPEFAAEPQDPQLQQFLSFHTCPVCGKAYTSRETTCLDCGFAGLNKVFINKDEADYWKEHVLIPYRQTYRNEQ